MKHRSYVGKGKVCIQYKGQIIEINVISLKKVSVLLNGIFKELELP